MTSSFIASLPVVCRPTHSVPRTSASTQAIPGTAAGARIKCAAEARPRRTHPRLHARARPRTSPPIRRTSSGRVRALFQRAKAAEQDGQYGAARELLKQCLELDVEDAHSWLALANLETRHTTVDAARDIFKRGLQHCPENVYLLQAFGVLEHRAGDRDAARKLFAQGSKADPSNAYVAHAWGLLEERVGNKEEARRLFSQALNLKPSAEVFKSWSLLEAREGNIEVAIQLLKDGVAACRANLETKGRKQAHKRAEANLLRQWAQLEERLGDLPKARQLLSDAIAAAPRASEAYVTLAQLEARRGSTKEALALIAVAISLAHRPPTAVYVAWAHIEWHYCKNVPKARKVLLDATEIHPRDPSLLQMLGDLENKCGNTEVSVELLKKSVQVRPTAAAFVTWALVEEAKGNYTASADLFERALAADSTHGAAYNAYGIMLARCGDVQAARTVYERGLRIAPSASVWHGYGQLELKHGGSPERAVELFREGTQRAAEDTAFVWHSWGMLELSRKRVKSARAVFADALRRYPRNSRLLVGAAWAASAASPGDSKLEHEARLLFKRAVASDPTHAHAWQAWAVFELRFERFDAAEALFKRGLRLCPGHGALWQAWGVLQSEKGNFDRARSIFKRGELASKGNVHLYQAWACMEVRCGNLVRARDLLKRAIAADKHHGPVWNAYGLLEARHGTPQMARKFFKRGIDLAPEHAPLYRTFGETEARLGNYEYARKLFRDGIRIDPFHAPLYHALAKMEAVLGNIDALAELKSQAELRFGGVEQAVKAIHEGGEREHPQDQANIESGYQAFETPMQRALDQSQASNTNSGEKL